MAQQIHLLPELQPVLLQWSKAVLRDRPEDVLTYSRDYFAEQATQRRMAGYVLPASESKPYGELSQENQERVELVFKRFDTDCDMNISVRNSPPQRSAPKLIVASPLPPPPPHAPSRHPSLPSRAQHAELQTMLEDLGGLFDFRPEDSATVMALLDADASQTISWQEWSHACAVWLHDMGA